MELGSHFVLPLFTVEVMTYLIVFQEHVGKVSDRVGRLLLESLGERQRHGSCNVILKQVVCVGVFGFEQVLHLF